jgi:hypothetical protein
LIIAQWLILGVLFACGSSASAATFNTHGFDFTAEPVLAYEYFQRDTPSRSRGALLLYGARFTAGKPNFSFEGEFTTGSETTGYTSPSVQTVTTKKENARVGARATASLSRILSSYLRFGGQASRISTTVTDTNSSISSERPWQYKPYLGTGLQFALAGMVSAGIDANYVFYSLENWSENSVQFSTSLQIHFNSK